MGGSIENKTYTPGRRTQSGFRFISCSSSAVMAVSLTSFVALFSCSWIFVLCQETQELKVKTGENATLQCQSHGGADISLIEWSRTDLKPDDGFVFLFSNDRSYEEIQHPYFYGRVELQDPEMKNGDASVILKNVNINDTGTYECLIVGKNSRDRKRDVFESISIIELTVTGHTAGHIWEGYVGVVCLLSLLLVAVGGFMVNQMIQRRHRPETTPDSESAEDALNPSSSSSV
ncbi:myelin protein P0-like [Micropterus salmoides]|uniref:myelin protein P0-like n=1 Tax=Micropterus salmoides TaxID=27706 RepID=UPI0018ECED17|nr:myelin protein P0-like [Micropterus salmoides]